MYFKVFIKIMIYGLNFIHKFKNNIIISNRLCQLQLAPIKIKAK